MDFKYFPDYERWARFTDTPCQCCGSTEQQCLEGIYFGDPKVPESVCVDCLVSRQMRADIPDHLRRNLKTSLHLINPEWSDEQIEAKASKLSDALSRTPPVPWIQHIEWPVCHGDFCRYLGEWDQVQINRESGNGDGYAYLLTILAEPASEEYLQVLWDAIATEWTTVFAFECLTCQRRIAVDQSF